ncbi:type I-D CRISPR-associated helicase Cas3' [Laspinema palackyanum]|uniref:type I-D CRISPR-associated helicase Cas3' n=1 Tax=Laspinema palackyanum TaxID=3231601 RepID=UPI00345CA389|nr:type I-D CRISPR-associated helicase Cas3' [Laspinema sp. D2c]
MSNEPLSIQLEARSIAACTSLPPELAFMGNALQHQVEVYERSRDHDLILALAPTGTGKTKGGLLTLLHQPTKSAVYIAPTNALITQQTEAAKNFLKEAGLDHVVIEASAAKIRQWPNTQVGARSGEKVYNLLRNPATIFPELGPKRPVLLVTNPDIFYYATFFAYNRLDRVNIASGFYTKFSTVIFDEFHLYDAKQLVGLLFYLAHSHIFRFFEQGRRVILLTATPEPACEVVFSNLEAQGVRIARIDGVGTSNLVPSQTAVNLELRSQPTKPEFIAELANEVVRRYQARPDCNGAVILDSLSVVTELYQALKAKGLGDRIGRITGPASATDRKWAMEQSIILATSTVDVGFNFERHPAPTRQNLDWLIFSARDRAAFWQRIGRVGRVLGKTETVIPSEAIGYLPDRAWEQGITNLDCSGGRSALAETLETIRCLDRPFWLAYWRSEAFLEIARPLLEMEEMLEKLPQHSLISELFESLRLSLGGKRTWSYYRSRIKDIRAARDLAKEPLKLVPGRRHFIQTFLKINCPEDWEEIQSGNAELEDIEKIFKSDPEAARHLKDFAAKWSASYQPIFQFRSGLFESLQIRDPQGLFLDRSSETYLDALHLLRYCNFVSDGEILEIQSPADPPYQVKFRLRYPRTIREFINEEMNKLNAFLGCKIQRVSGDAIAPMPFIESLEKEWFPGVIICPLKNGGPLYRLRQARIESFPITLNCNDGEKDYEFFPGLSGILALATEGVKLRLPDEQDFYCV